MNEDFYLQLNEEIKIFDVASAPGCLNIESDLNYRLLPALPGKYFPQDAADLLAQVIVRKNTELREG